MSKPKPVRVHLIAGGFPVGSPAGHDMDYARLRILQLLQENPNVATTVTNDFTDIEKWLFVSESLSLQIRLTAEPSSMFFVEPLKTYACEKVFVELKK